MKELFKFSEPISPTVSSVVLNPTSPMTKLDLTWSSPGGNPSNVAYKGRLDALTAVTSTAAVTLTSGTHTFSGLVSGEGYTAFIWAVAVDDITRSTETSSSTAVYTSKQTTLNKATPN